MRVITSEDDAYSYPLHMQGSASTLPEDNKRDIGAELRAVYEEVTGKKIEPIQKRRMGFLD